MARLKDQTFHCGSSFIFNIIASSELYTSQDRMQLRHYFSFDSLDPKSGFVSKAKPQLRSATLESFSVPAHDAPLSAARRDSAKAPVAEDESGSSVPAKVDSAQASFMERQPESSEGENVDSGKLPIGLAAHLLPKHSIPTSIDSDLEALQLPDTLQFSRESASHGFDVKSLAQAHFVAFQVPQSSTTAKFNDWTIKAATKQIHIICKAFPYLNNSMSLLSMCAWFHLFCFFDDETEKMSAKEAKIAMKHCISILEKTCRTKAAGATALQRANVHYTLWLSSRLPSGGTIAFATYLFVQQAQRLLRTETLNRVAAKIIQLFKAYSHEIECRENINNLSVDAYRKLRSGTIGLAPFWEILRGNLFFEMERNFVEATSLKLESHVAAVVGLQNDLVGLAKDLEDGDQMNYVSLRAERESLNTRQALAAAIELHNRTVREAVEERRTLESLWPDSWKGNGSMRIYADSMLGFMTTHFMWASASRRYEPVQARLES